MASFIHDTFPMPKHIKTMRIRNLGSIFIAMAIKYRRVLSYGCSFSDDLILNDIFSI